MPRQKSYIIRSGRYHASEPLRCGAITYAQDNRHKGRTPQYGLVYVSTGKLVYSDAQHARVEIGPGDAFQRFPEQPHEVFSGAGTSTHFVAVPAEIFQMMRAMGLRTLDHPRLRLGTRHQFLARHAQIARELSATPPQRLMLTLTRMQQLIVDMHLHALARESAPAWARRVEEACVALSSNFQQGCALPELAAKLDLSYSNFRKIFRATTGMAPGDYRVRRRIERAQELLMEGMPIKAIAKELGYSDLYAFSSQFKKFTGLAPRRYRAERG